VLDIRNKQIQTQDISFSGFYDLISIYVELKTGNAYVVSSSNAYDSVLVEINKENTIILGVAFIGV
jgi:hypothetical protein